MVSVIIPTLNEEEHIASVVSYARAQPHVSEVIVVDDKSLDKTVSIARANGAKVISSTRLGKGASMKDGIIFASNEIIVFLDGDIDPYPPATIRLLTEPILSDEADFVKSTFSRDAGRVTELVAKPLLSIFFPDLSRFSQPLSGMIAGKRSQLLDLEFREDYGVDIGILIDMYLMNIRVKEVEIGYLENKSKPWQALGKMSKEVAHAIIVKASGTKNPKINFEELAVMKEIRSQMEFALDDSLLSLNKAIAFDMDNTLLKNRFIDVCADKFGFREELMNIRSAENDSIVRSKRIAILLKGIALRDLIDTVESIPVTDDAQQVIAELKTRGYLVGIISDSYDCICNHIKNKLRMDFSLSNELEFSQSICTGEVRIPSFFFNSSGSICKHPVCKTNALIKITNRYRIPMKNCLAVGDSINDLCMIRTAGLGISFCTSEELLKHYADMVISTPSFASILDHAR